MTGNLSKKHKASGAEIKTVKTTDVRPASIMYQAPSNYTDDEYASAKYTAGALSGLYTGIKTDMNLKEDAAWKRSEFEDIFENRNSTSMYPSLAGLFSVVGNMRDAPVAGDTVLDALWGMYNNYACLQNRVREYVRPHVQAYRYEDDDYPNQTAGIDYSFECFERLYYDPLESITFSTGIPLPSELHNYAYEKVIYFESGSTPTTVSYESGVIRWFGADCDEEHDFIPSANTQYEISIKFFDDGNSTNYIARVGYY